MTENHATTPSQEILNDILDGTTPQESDALRRAFLFSGRYSGFFDNLVNLMDPSTPTEDVAYKNLFDTRRKLAATGNNYPTVRAALSCNGVETQDMFRDTTLEALNSMGLALAHELRVHKPRYDD